MEAREEDAGTKREQQGGRALARIEKRGDGAQGGGGGGEKTTTGIGRRDYLLVNLYQLGK